MLITQWSQGFRPLAGNWFGKNWSELVENASIAVQEVSVPLRGIGLESVPIYVYECSRTIYCFRPLAGNWFGKWVYTDPSQNPSGGKSFRPLAGNWFGKMWFISLMRLRQSSVSVPLRGIGLESSESVEWYTPPEFLFPSPCGELVWKAGLYDGLMVEDRERVSVPLRGIGLERLYLS